MKKTSYFLVVVAVAQISLWGFSTFAHEIEFSRAKPETPITKIDPETLRFKVINSEKINRALNEYAAWESETPEARLLDFDGTKLVAFVAGELHPRAYSEVVNESVCTVEVLDSLEVKRLVHYNQQVQTGDEFKFDKSVYRSRILHAIPTGIYFEGVDFYLNCKSFGTSDGTPANIKDVKEALLGTIELVPKP